MLMKSELTETKAEVKMVGEGVAFERVRRITGYLVGTLDAVAFFGTLGFV